MGKMTGKEIVYEDLRCLFHLPLEEAAMYLQVCDTLLKQICRKLGIAKWPFRIIGKWQATVAKLKALEHKGKSAKCREKRQVRVRKAEAVLAHIVQHGELPEDQVTAALEKQKIGAGMAAAAHPPPPKRIKRKVSLPIEPRVSTNASVLLDAKDGNLEESDFGDMSNQIQSGFRKQLQFLSRVSVTSLECADNHENINLPDQKFEKTSPAPGIPSHEPRYNGDLNLLSALEIHKVFQDSSYLYTEQYLQELSNTAFFDERQSYHEHASHELLQEQLCPLA